MASTTVNSRSSGSLTDLPEITSSLVHPKHSTLSLNSSKRLVWKCIGTPENKGCGGTWRESVAHRIQFMRCPKCEIHDTRKHIKVKSVHGDVTDTKNIDCPICYLSTPLSKSTACPMCSYRVCCECLRMHIVSGNSPAKCINQTGGCEKDLNTTYLTATFGREWVRKEYRTFLATIYLERERGLLQTTQQLIPAYRKLQRLTQLSGRTERWLEKHSYTDNIAKQYNVKLRQYEDMNLKILNLSTVIDELVNLEDGRIVSANITQKTYIQGCPIDGCNGLIDTEFQCEVCGSCICGECRVPLDPKQSHVCLPSDIATTKAMIVNTKPCPKCAAAIYKIDGCDQMWCVVCKVAFSWVTGAIETGKIHNPEYYNWLRQKSLADGGDGSIPRDEDDIEPTHITASSILMTTVGLQKTFLMKKAYAAAQRELLTDIQDIEAETLHSLRTLRARYLVGHITLDEWQKRIPFFYRKRWMLRHKDQVYKAMSNAIIEIIHDFERAAVELFTIICDEKTASVRTLYEATMDRVEELRQHFNAIIISENMDMSATQFTVYDSVWDDCKYSMVRVSDTVIDRESYYHRLLQYPPLPSEVRWSDEDSDGDYSEGEVYETT